MKAIYLKFPVLALTLALMAFSSCTKNSNNISNGSVQAQIQTNAQSGSWRITKFVDSGNDELNHFAGYVFTFGNSGVLTAQNAANNYTGTWSITDSNSGDDSQDDLDFNISFNLANDFEDLNDDWHFISHSSGKIELIDVSGGNGGTDYLTFEKM